VPAPPAPTEEPRVWRQLVTAALCAAAWPLPLALAAAPPPPVLVDVSLLGASAAAHLAMLLAGRAIEPVGRGALLLGGAGLACCVALLALATPSHGHGAPTLLGMMLLVEAAALVARRRDATRREVALVLAHAPALPALCLLPDGSPAEHAAALGLAYANLFLLRLLPHLREGGAPAGPRAARLGLRGLALLPLALRGAMMWWAHPSFYRDGPRHGTTGPPLAADEL